MVQSSPGRDIDLVLVTGAGASRDFGINRSQLPLMADWSEDLVQRLRQRANGYPEATGLASGMEPEAFERQLGMFLRSVSAFDRIEPLLEAITLFPLNAAPLMAADQWTAWHRGAAFQLEQITAVIHESLYELFAAPPIDPYVPAEAYRTLLGWFGLGMSSSWVYATTNYDTIAEIAIDGAGGLPDAGDVLGSMSTAERPIRVDRLLDGMPRYVPVLHLHGRVGWLRRPREGAYSVDLKTYDSRYGVPIVMLPDLEKDYATDPLINTLWQQFEEALARAKRVLVLGHSLHDTALVQALHEHVHPPERLMITVLPVSPNGDEPSDPAEADRIQKELPGAMLVPLRFGPTIEAMPEAMARRFEYLSQINVDG
jgi:hypothetical protein